MTDKPTQEAKKALIRAIVFDGYHTTRMKDADVAEHILAKLGNRFDTLLANTRTELLREARKGFKMVHDALADQGRPRQACGEIAAHWLQVFDAHLKGEA